MTEKQKKILISEPNLKKERIHRILERVCSKVTGPFLPLKRPEATNSLASHPLIRYQSIASFRQISQDSSQTLLGGERRCEYLVPKHNTMTQPGLEAGPHDLETTALNTTESSFLIPTVNS